MSKSPATITCPLTVPQDMLERIIVLATRNGKSINETILHHLKIALLNETAESL